MATLLEFRRELFLSISFFQLPHDYAKGISYNDQTSDQLLTYIYEILKERDLEEEKEKKVFAPHFIFIITNRQLISEHAILEYLEGEHEDIGFSTIFAADTKESLSENIHTLVRYINDGQGDIRSEEHTSELQSRGHLVCRLLLEKKKEIKQYT